MTRSLLPNLKRRKKKTSRRLFSGFFVDMRRLAIGVGTTLVLSILMSIHFLPDRVSLNLGDRSPTEIRAARSVTYVDSDATRNLREAAAGRVSTIYDFDPTALAQADRSVDELFDSVRRIRADAKLTTPSRRLDRLSIEWGTSFSKDQLRYLLVSSPVVLDRLQNRAHHLAEDAMKMQIRSDTEDLAHAKDDYSANAQKSAHLPVEIGILQTLGRRALGPNSVPDRRKTEQQREAAMMSVAPVTGAIRSGDVVLHSGEVFTQQHLDQCRALGLISPRLDFVTGLSIFLLAAGMVFLVGYYIRRHCSTIYVDPKLLLLLSSLAVFSVFGLRLFGTLLGIPLSIVQFGYLGMMMVVATGMLITVLLNANLAVLVTALLSMQSGLIMNHEIRFAVMAMIGSLVGIYSVSSIRDRTHLLRATFALAVTNVALVWVLGGLLGDTVREDLTGSAWALAAAAFAIAIFWFGVAILEKPFGTLTHVWLLELSASERPLLRELCLTAPGTYAHSIMVGNLAEAGADAISADSLFCRVASYYHDIGKIRRPHCFIENQRSENIHDRLTPSLSALIIASHVRDGLELATEHRLPQQIKNVIAEHHGTSLIQYFYSQALAVGSEEGRHDPILEQHFRYEGPRPQTRESGIIMLADSVEAAARSLDKPSPARIQGLVEKVLYDKLMDGQLDECDLTFKDIRKIQAAFVRILSAMLHNRIDYPELPRLPGSPAISSDLKPISTDGSLYSESTEAPHKDEAVVARRTGDPSERRGETR